MSKQHPHAPVSPRLAVAVLTGFACAIAAITILLVACEGVG